MKKDTQKSIQVNKRNHKMLLLLKANYELKTIDEVITKLIKHFKGER